LDRVFGSVGGRYLEVRFVLIGLSADEVDDLAVVIRC